ncbi:hypothetical protein TREVI0001_1128 [Treponema vincentii ATCC 35580]|uniref:Uncharacterized protein n=1 Tax=Treponema vincentii ATCC 35580 TaxID=596324 RepID=C8PRW5_9SPIR|nr:hypothetical protein TREVI0001_1128 [Treponema vincentii ATCC 35580]
MGTSKKPMRFLKIPVYCSGTPSPRILVYSQKKCKQIEKIGNNFLYQNK